MFICKAVGSMGMAYHLNDADKLEALHVEYMKFIIKKEFNVRFYEWNDSDFGFVIEKMVKETHENEQNWLQRKLLSSSGNGKGGQNKGKYKTTNNLLDLLI